MLSRFLRALVWYYRGSISRTGDGVLARLYRRSAKGAETMFTKIAYYATLATSALVGLWHFFVPVMFRWYDYLPMQYTNLIVAIDWINYCFSAFLLGVSCLCLFWGRRALSGNREARQLYLFLTAIWVFRACLALFIEPWPPEPVPWAAVLQLVASTLLAAIMVVVAVRLARGVGAGE